MGGLFTIAAIMAPMCVGYVVLDFLLCSLPEKMRQRKAVAYLRARNMHSDL